ncbi:17060_t:CDS:2, partial [Racocetra fulgida]
IKELQEKINVSTEDKILIEKLQNEKKELEKELKDATEDLLEAEDALASCDISSERHYHEKAKEKNINRLKESGFKEKDIDELCQLQNEITRLKLELDGMKKTPLAIEGSSTNKLLIDYPVFSQELNRKVKDFLDAKQIFLNARAKTIEELQQCLNKLETFINGKYAVSLEIGNAIGASEAVKAISNLTHIGISKKSNKEFQLSLGNEENELALMNEDYNSLLNLLENNKDIFHNEKMESAIISLSENLDLLKGELEQEKKQ